MIDERTGSASEDLRGLRCELLALLGRKEEAAKLFTQLEQIHGASWRANSNNATRLLIRLGRLTTR